MGGLAGEVDEVDEVDGAGWRAAAKSVNASPWVPNCRGPAAAGSVTVPQRRQYQQARHKSRARAATGPTA